MIPPQERNLPLVWVLVSDSMHAKSVARYFITDVEGGEVDRFQFARRKPAQATTDAAAGEEEGERSAGGETAAERGEREEG